MKPALLHARVDDVRIVVRGRMEPTEAEFAAHMAEALKMADAVRVVLVLVENDAQISPAARAKLIRAGLLQPPHAILANSLLARAEMTATGPLGANVRMFATDEFEPACDFLRIPSSLRPKILEQIESMKAKLVTDGSFETSTGPR